MADSDPKRTFAVAQKSQTFGLWAEKRSGSVRLRIEPDGAKRRKTYKIAEFAEGGPPVPSMFEPSGTIVVSIGWPRIAALAQFLP